VGLPTGIRGRLHTGVHHPKCQASKIRPLHVECLLIPHVPSHRVIMSRLENHFHTEREKEREKERERERGREREGVRERETPEGVY